MSYLHNDPSVFREEMIDGFVAVHSDLVRRVSGGVARRHAAPEGHVAVVVGGGSGHYPAFAGLVGPGLAHAAAMGGVFASPSAAQVEAAARAVDTGAGVLLAYGNYAGDVLNFDSAQAELRADGIPCRSVAVTDDIASAGPDEQHRRRGLAGDLVVFKAAAWAAEQGRTLDDVAEVAQLANARTRTLGVAYTGSTLPGADQPLFTIPDGRMGLGIGIHGEPGLDELPVANADETAAMMIDRLLEESPADAGRRLGVIVNGLGSVKGEELFVYFAGVRRHLLARGYDLVAPQVGEFVTSFEMAGVSLTLVWLTDELEAAWCAPVWTPSLRTGATPPPDATRLADDVEGTAVDEPVDGGDATSDRDRALAMAVSRAFAAGAAAIDAEVDDLGRLDSIAGDGDHGIGMQRGITAAASAAALSVRHSKGLAGTLDAAGRAWAEKAGGTSGALWGLGLRTAAAHLSRCDDATEADIATAVAAGIAAIREKGGARVGDKTMVDAAAPFAKALAARGGDRSAAWLAAAGAASRGAAETARLGARTGRARAHGDKGIGHPDPGAVSFALLANVAVTTLLPTLTEGAHS
ncbi:MULTISPECIES: dihydroxyacetone kinase family protein [Microbacterium]|uniref:dihydroxyacetone kinase family protein n=1 Tax=Microbacterium TaxID=33882 RepID=UPI002783469B|nr:MULTISPECIES: dihydroxyacetone kinase family protein [Microbacterium]MDQ1082708.1 dihydroxyacetone kinase [Microbacterium sp. SORGH_AS_0344]MDQ1168521.1 dihydroxyacetone kinase [Microbacterium proteolyticum]